jgi:purine-binding chemotaxis protein CheW
LIMAKDLQELILADEAEAAPQQLSSAELVRRAGQQGLVFSLAGTKYAVPAAKLEELGYVPKITRVPNLPDWLRGVTVWRGQIIPVLDLRALLGQKSGQSGRMLVVRTRDDMLIGLIVDQINTILELSGDQLQELSPAADPAPDEKLLPHIKGACQYRGQLIAWLDVDSLLSFAELQQLDAI